MNKQTIGFIVAVVVLSLLLLVTLICYFVEPAKAACQTMIVDMMCNTKQLGKGNMILLWGSHDYRGISKWNSSAFSSAEEYGQYWGDFNQAKLKIALQRIMKLDTGTKVLSSRNKKICLHFRCSDIPFNRHQLYPLLSRSYFSFVKDILDAQYPDHEMYISFCPDNKPVLRYNIYPDLCNQYKSAIESYLGRSCTILCESIRDTWKFMLECEALVSTGGSFSFVPGVLKGTSFITPRLYGDVPLKKNFDLDHLHQHVSWTMYDRAGSDIIPHSDIDDYSTFDYHAYLNN